MKLVLFKYIALLLLLTSSSLMKATIPSDFKQLECLLKKVTRSSQHQSHPHIPLTNRADSSKFSNNWGGYVAQTKLKNPQAHSVSAVYGSWVVPSIKPSAMSTYSAIWIGIDGHSSPTVEQIGTAHNWINGSEQHYAWFEMYPQDSYVITSFLISAGDVISASVKYKKNVFVMRLYNNTKKVVVTIPAEYTTSATAQRKSAEWIVEAPFLNTTLPLANFSTAYLFGCKAKIKNVTGSIESLLWDNAQIEMRTESSITKAAPSSLLPNDGGSFFVTWKHE